MNESIDQYKLIRDQNSLNNSILTLKTIEEKAQNLNG